MKYTIKHLRAEFGTDSKCLQKEVLVSMKSVYHNQLPAKKGYLQIKMINITYFIDPDLTVREVGEAPRNGYWEKTLKKFKNRMEARQYVIRLMDRNSKKGYVSALIEQ